MFSGSYAPLQMRNDSSYPGHNPSMYASQQQCEYSSTEHTLLLQYSYSKATNDPLKAVMPENTHTKMRT